MWRFVLVVFFIFSFQPSLAQNHRTDSLLLALRNSTSSAYPAVFSILEQTVVEMKYTPALKITDEVLAICQQLPFRGALVSAYRCKAIVYNLHQNRVQAIQTAQQAYQLALTNTLAVEEANSLKLMGNIYQAMNRHDLALDHYLKAFEIYHQHGHQRLEAETLYDLGNLCYYTHKYNTSRRYLLQAYQLGRDSLNSRLLISTINTVALTYRAKQEFDQAIHYQTLSHQMAIQAKDSAWIGLTAGNLGHIYELQQAYQKALAYYRLDITFSKKFKMWGSVGNNFVSIANVYLQKKDYLKAKMYLDSAMYLTDSVKEPDFLHLLYKTSSEFYLQTNQLDKAFQYQALQYKLKDSLDQRKYNAELEGVMANYEWDKKRAEIELLKKNNEIIQADAQQKYIILVAISLILICIVALALILYRNNRQKHKVNLQLISQQKELAERNEEIKLLNSSLEQKVEQRTGQLHMAIENLVKKNQHLEDFAYVISHNLRAPIARIMGLVSIFDRENVQDKNNLVILDYLNQATINLDMVVSDLNDILLMQDLSDIRKENVHLEEITNLTIESLHDLIEESHASIQTDYSQVSNLVTVKSYLTSILYNLLSNAIKYRSPKRLPEILISTSKVNGSVCLTVKDNGIGLDLTQKNTKKIFKLYQRMHTHTEGKGMGLFIVKEQVEALEGKIEVESAVDYGSAFHVYLPA